MTSLDVGIAALRSSLTALRSSVASLPSVAALRSAADRGYELYDRSSARLKGMMPTGLYARALLIIRPLIHCLRSARRGLASGTPKV